MLSDLRAEHRSIPARFSGRSPSPYYVLRSACKGLGRCLVHRALGTCVVLCFCQGSMRTDTSRHASNADAERCGSTARSNTRAAKPRPRCYGAGVCTSRRNMRCHLPAFFGQKQQQLATPDPKQITLTTLNAPGVVACKFLQRRDPCRFTCVMTMPLDRPARSAGLSLRTLVTTTPSTPFMPSCSATVASSALTSIPSVFSCELSGFDGRLSLDRSRGQSCPAAPRGVKLRFIGLPSRTMVSTWGCPVRCARQEVEAR